MEKHKHADVLIAIAEGKEVQWKECGSSKKGEWVTSTNSCLEEINPIAYPNMIWRVKPEVKESWVNIYKEFDNSLFIGGCSFESKEEAIKHRINHPNLYLLTTVELTSLLGDL